MPEPVIIPATPEDCAALAPFAAKLFALTFGHLYTLENLNSHLTTQCNEAYFREALAAGDTILLLKDGTQLAGYGKFGHVGLPVTGTIPPGAVEIHRVYIDTSYQGRGFGKMLLQHMLNLPQLALAPILYIGVWEENLIAQTLYMQYGFKQVGMYLYHVGTQSDRELILARSRH